MQHVEPLRPEDPRWIDRYRLTGRLGEGGQGVVYHADHGGEPVAIKVLHARLVRDPKVHTRLQREIELMRRVGDLYSAKVLDFGSDTDRVFIVTEYVDGPSLQARVEGEGPLRDGALARLMVGTVSALVAMHRDGVLHRDITPRNVLMGPDGPRLIDFGIARALDTNATVTGGLVGTPAYIAPERLGTERPRPPADVFSWAATMVYAATGRRAFEADSYHRVLHRVLNDEPDIADVPSRFRELIERCLAKEPERRPKASDVLDALLHGGAAPDVTAPDRPKIEEPYDSPANEPPAPHPDMSIDRPPPERPVTPPAPVNRRRGLKLVTVGAVALVLAGSVTAYWLTRGHRAARSAVPPPRPPAITVGSGNFPESTLLAEVYAQALEAKGIRVVRKFNIGTREVYYDQLRSGSVAVMPEYNGALATFLNESADTTSTAKAALELRNRLPTQLQALNPAKAEDKDSVTVNKKTADLYGLHTIEDLKPVQGQIVMGAPDEFRTRLQGLVGLRGAYGLNRLGFVAFKTDDRAHMIEQLKQDNIQAADLFTTESAIESDHFVVLSDPKHVFGVQNVTPVIYRTKVDSAARTVLNAVSAHLTTEDLRFMNMRVSVNQVDPAAVAKDWLQRTGLIR